MVKSKKTAIFLDRDGTVIYDVGYPKDPGEVQLLPGVVEALSKLQKYGFYLVIVSNQSGVGRDIITKEEAKQVHDKVISILNENGVRLDAAYYCPHLPEDMCQCRKPMPELLFRAAKEFDIDLVNSFMIGDKQIDIEAGKNAGCNTILLRVPPLSGIDSGEANYIATNWEEIVKYILFRIDKGYSEV